jgi:hypothetical protein
VEELDKFPLARLCPTAIVAENPLSMGLGEDLQIDEYSGYELDMITNLQRRWRVYFIPS